MRNRIVHDGKAEVFPHPKSRFARFAISTLPYVVLYALAVVLIAMTDHNPVSVRGAWNYFVPLIGLVSAISAWDPRAGKDWETRASFLLRQVVHWGSVLLVIHLLFQSDVQHFLRAETDGFVIIYILGLAGILSGLYLDWRMAVFGLFLITSGIVIAYLDDNALLIIVSGAATIGVVLTAWIWIWHQGRKDSQQPKVLEGEAAHPRAE